MRLSIAAVDKKHGSLSVWRMFSSLFWFVGVWAPVMVQAEPGEFPFVLFPPTSAPATRPIRTSNGLEVIGAGFPRTGTLSLHHALNILGYETYHMKCVNTTEIVNTWHAYFTGKKELRQVAQETYHANGYTAAVDAPTMGAWQELAELYPKAKIILSERETPEKWFESASETVMIETSLTRNFLFVFPPFGRAFGQMSMAFWKHVLKYDGPMRRLSLADKELALETYRRNSAQVRQWQAEGRRDVLVFQFSQGWEPLCKFLGKPIPDVPFPNVNSRQKFKQSVQEKGIMVASVVVFMSLGMIFLLYWFCVKKRQEKKKKKKSD